MQKSTVWLMVGIGATVALMITACCAFAMISGKGKKASRVSAGLDVDLEKLTRAFEAHVNTGAKDLNGFEKDVNNKAKGIYKGKDYVKVTMDKKGDIVGYVNKNTEPTYEQGKDQMVFSMAYEKDKQRVVARDNSSRYYGYRPSSSGFFTGMLVGNMLSSQRTYYPGGYYRAPTTARWVSSGYYNRAYRSYSSGSRYSRSGSSYRSSRSSSRSGSFGFGK